MTVNLDSQSPVLYLLIVGCEAAFWAVLLASLVVRYLLHGSDAVTAPMLAWYRYGFGCIVFWFIFGPAWNLIFFQRKTQ